MAGAIESAPVKDLESITGIQPLCDRRDKKTLVQDAKFKRLTDHPMNQRMGRPVCRRIKRNSFLHQAKELIKQNTDPHNHNPKEIPTCLSVPPWKSEAQGAHLEQIDSTATYSEEKTIIKSCLKRKWKLEHPKYNKADANNGLEKHE